MTRFRVTIRDTPDRAEQLRLANRIRSFLIENVPVRLDPEFPLPGVHRDERGEAYFEFATEEVAKAAQSLRDAGQFPFAAVTEPQVPTGEACSNCGNVAGEMMPAVCPNCGFRDISPCPVCHGTHPRGSYEKVAGNLFLCPTRLDGVRHRVRLAFNEPLIDADGTYRQPRVVVREAASR